MPSTLFLHYNPCSLLLLHGRTQQFLFDALTLPLSHPERLVVSQTSALEKQEGSLSDTSGFALDTVFLRPCQALRYSNHSATAKPPTLPLSWTNYSMTRLYSIYAPITSSSPSRPSWCPSPARTNVHGTPRVCPLLGTVLKGTAMAKTVRKPAWAGFTTRCSVCSAKMMQRYTGQIVDMAKMLFTLHE